MNRTKSVLAAASLLFAISLTLSCSGDGGGSPSETIGTTTKKAQISGVSQKGPFIEGSTATLYELNEKFAQTGRNFRDIIADNKGSFEIRNIELISQFAMLEASGYYRNENTGKVSASPITLFAIADLREKDQVNVNILTHLEYYRVLNLAENEGKSVKEAKKQAQHEIFAVFGINGDSFKDSEDMSIFGTTESDAALLAISVLLQSNLGEGEFSQRLTNFSQAIRNGGSWNDEEAKTAIADWASGANLSSIRSNITGWGLASDVPAFEKYVRDYWAVNYGLGECNAESKDVMKQNANASSSKRANHYICNGSYWESTLPTLVCSNFSGKGYDGIAIDEPVLSCSVGELSNASYANAPVWANPAKGMYNVRATATCGSATGLTVNCGSLNVIDQPTLSCSMFNSSVFEGAGIAQPFLTCSDGSMPFDGVLKGTLPDWNNLKPGAYAVSAEANCGVEILSANCGSLEVKPVELTCSTMPTSAFEGDRITPPALTCNNWDNATNLVWTNTPTWNNPVAGIYSDISVSATCGNATRTANCNGPLTVKVPCSANNNTETQYCSERVMKEYGYVTYGGQTYKTVVIGTQTWMAENLNYNVESSVCYDNDPAPACRRSYYCYDNDPANCEIYGRLYDWTTAMNGASGSYANPSGVRGICPEGWHLPSRAEWNVLIDYVDSRDEWGNRSWNSETKLKATNGWNNYWSDVSNKYESWNGTDDFGFSALPSGNSPTTGIGMMALYLNTAPLADGACNSVFAINNVLGYSCDGGGSIRCVKN
ncbi:MAG: hypothetical protein FWB90_06705 [Fibromonadales bacterium]|nr:hypothetical protein [Fibromonadales bacterium]